VSQKSAMKPKRTSPKRCMEIGVGVNLRLC
jgi:hypothetical protein